MAEAYAPPTPERIAKAGEMYQPPVMTRETERPYTRIIPWYEHAWKQSAITQEQAQVAVRIDHLWHKASDELFLSAAYGDQRWNGTPASQSASVELEPVEWRTMAVKRVREVKAHLPGVTWRALEHAISQNATMTEVGHAFGKVSERWARQWASRQITVALDKIADLWQMRPKPT